MIKQTRFADAEAVDPESARANRSSVVVLNGPASQIQPSDWSRSGRPGVFSISATPLTRNERRRRERFL